MSDPLKPELKLVDADPFDPERIKLSPTEEVTAAERVLGTVAVRKPKKQEFVRTHPTYQQTASLLEYEREFYLVDRAVRPLLAVETKPVVLYTCMTRTNVLFLWPVRLPGEDGRNNSWWDSAHEAAKLAKDQWVRVVASSDAAAYELSICQVEVPEPSWPEKSFRDILSIAFKNYLITDLDHMIVKRLQGRL
jgi:hypothetical protein